MNERIVKLFMQSVDSKYIPLPVEDHIPLWAEKFAELIVRECLEACSRANEIKHFVPPTQEQVVLSCMREIETTFRS